MAEAQSIRKVAGLALILACLALLASMAAWSRPAFAADAQLATSKDETVHVRMAADGTVTDVKASVVLKNGSAADELIDACNLTGLKSDDGKAFAPSGDSIVWAAGGDDVFYEGSSAAELPVVIRISYFLDGQPIAPDQIAGKSGHVTIRFDYENRSCVQAAVRGVSQSVYTPFTCVTACMFDSDDFKGITVENGKTVQDGNDVVVMGYAIPGLKQSLGPLADGANVPDYFSVSADVVDFQMQSTMTIVTAGVMSEVDLNGFSLDGMSDADALSGAMAQLVDSSTVLTSGLDSLRDGIAQVESGAGSLVQGAGSIREGLYLLLHGNGTTPGLEDAVAGANGLVAALEQIQQPIDALADGQTGLPAAAGALQQASVDPQTFVGAAALLAKYQETMDPEDYATLQASLQGAATMAETVNAVTPGVTAASEGAQSLSAGMAKLVAQAQALPAGLSQAVQAVSNLYAGSGSLYQGAQQLSDATSQLESGAQAAAEGSDKLTQGMTAFNEQGVSKLVNMLQNDYGGLLDRVHALSDAASAYDDFTGKAAGTPSSVQFVFETDPVKRAS